MTNGEIGNSRRNFMKAGVAAAATLSLGGATVPTATAHEGHHEHPIELKDRIYKAVKSIGSHNAETVKAKFAEYKAMGFDGFESGSATMRDAYYQATLETGFRFHGSVCPSHWATRFSDPDPAVRAQQVETLRKDILNTHVLGGASVLIVPGRVSGEDETHDDVWHRSIAELKKVLPLCADLGVRLLIETVWNGFCEDPETFRDYIDAFDSPWVGAYFDIGNMQKFAPAHEWIRILGNRTVKLDVKDWGVKPGFCRLGEGDVDWDKVRDELIKIEFTGWATREGRDRDLQDTSKLMDQLLLGIS